MSQTPRQINFTIVPDEKSPGGASRTYANFCAVSHTPFDMTITLGTLALTWISAGVNLWFFSFSAMPSSARAGEAASSAAIAYRINFMVPYPTGSPSPIG